MCFNCGGSHSSRRGGEAFLGNSYSTWMNNCGNLFDNPTRADASWLSNGDYDRAFKGYPSHKTINIFMNTGYETQSWGSTLLGGFIGLGIQGLGLWALSGLFGRKKAQAQPQYSAGVGTGFWTNYFSNLKMPSWSLGSTTTQTQVQQPELSITNVNNTNQGNNAQTVSEINNNNNNNNTIATCTANNGNNVTVTGNIIFTQYESNCKYPKQFITADKTVAGNSNNKANQYFYVLTNDPVEDNKQPEYKCVGAYIFTNNEGNHTFNEVTYVTDTNSFTKKGDKFEINKRGINMDAVSDSKTCITNPEKFDYASPQPKQYGSPFKSTYAAQYTDE